MNRLVLTACLAVLLLTGCAAPPRAHLPTPHPGTTTARPSSVVRTTSEPPLPTTPVPQSALPGHLAPAHPVPVTRMPLSAGNPHPDGQERILRLPGGTGHEAYAQVWLPGAYFEPAQRATRFPVVLFLGAERGDGPGLDRVMHGRHVFNALIRDGAITPPIVVYLGGQMVNGVDSECVDVPGVPHQTWLAHTVVDEIAAHFRTAPRPTRWFVAGWSTGGWCAAILAAKYPTVFAAGASMAGYYHPLFDSIGVLRGDTRPLDENSLVTMARAGTLPAVPVLSIMSTHDTEAWGVPGSPPVGGQYAPDGGDFHAAAARCPTWQFLVLDRGTHAATTYLPWFGALFSWLGARGL